MGSSQKMFCEGGNLGRLEKRARGPLGVCSWNLVFIPDNTPSNSHKKPSTSYKKLKESNTFYNTPVALRRARDGVCEVGGVGGVGVVGHGMVWRWRFQVGRSDGAGVGRRR